jgi:hypothetical protein
MKLANLSILVFMLALSGCAGQFVPIQTIDKVGISALLAAEKIKIVSPEKTQTMQSLGEVVGHSCQNQIMVGESVSSKVGAIDQLRIVAAQLGATAVSEPRCEEGNVSLFKNCWNSWECKATAFRE